MHSNACIFALQVTEVTTQATQQVRFKRSFVNKFFLNSFFPDIVSRYLYRRYKYRYRYRFNSSSKYCASESIKSISKYRVSINSKIEYRAHLCLTYNDWPTLCANFHSFKNATSERILGVSFFEKNSFAFYRKPVYMTINRFEFTT